MYSAVSSHTRQISNPPQFDRQDFDFDENSPKYRCCCDWVRATTGTLLFAVVGVVLSVTDLIWIMCFTPNVTNTLYTIGLVSGPFVLLLSGLMILAVLLQNAVFFVIPMSILLLSSITLLLCAIGGAAWLYWHGQHAANHIVNAVWPDMIEQSANTTAVVIGLVVCLCASVLCAWLFYIVRSSYRFYVDLHMKHQQIIDARRRQQRLHRTGPFTTPDYYGLTA